MIASSLSATGRPQRGGGGIAVMVALTLLVFGVVAVLSGCGGGGQQPKLEKPTTKPKPPAPSPTATPVVNPRTSLPCFSYVYGATATDIAAMQDAGIVAVMDYDQRGICERVAGSRMRIIFPFYYGRADTFDVVEQITAQQLANVAGCRNRVVATYPVDEPDVKDLPRAAVELMVASAGRAFPGVPRLVTFGEKSSLKAYAGLTWKGAELYSRGWRDPKLVAERVHDASIVAVPRAFDNGGKYWGAWSDADMAAFVKRLVPDLQRGPTPAALFYTYADNLTVGKRDTGWRDLPLTRAAIHDACR